MNLPDIGITMYHVQEHYYYIPGSALVQKEYCVCEGTVERYYHGGYTEFVVVGKDPDGHPTPYHYRQKDVGEKVFYTESEAIQHAEHLTDKHEHAWGWCDGKLRRPWRKDER